MADHRHKKVKKIMTCSEVSKVLRLKKGELKAFEKEGLFDYADSNRQKIDAQNFERLKVAVTLKRELGVNTAGIDVILNMREKMALMQTEFNSFLIEVRRRLGTRLLKNLRGLSRE